MKPRLFKKHILNTFQLKIHYIIKHSCVKVHHRSKAKDIWQNVNTNITIECRFHSTVMYVQQVIDHTAARQRGVTISLTFLPSRRGYVSHLNFSLDINFDHIIFNMRTTKSTINQMNPCVLYTTCEYKIQETLNQTTEPYKMKF